MVSDESVDRNHEHRTVRMSFGEHLEDMRRRLILVIVGAVVGLIVCFVFKEHIMAWLIAPLDVALAAHGQPRQLVTLQPTEAFVVVFKMCLLTGLALSAPWGIWQVWAFVAEGLYPREQRFVRRIAPASIGLFAAGVLFLFYVVLPVVLSFLISIGSWVPIPEPGSSWLARKVLAPTTQTATATAPAATDGLQVPILEADPADPQPGQVWVHWPRLQLRMRIGDDVYSAPLRREGTGSFVQPGFSLSFYVTFVLHLAIGFGLGFQVPIVVVFLAIAGVMSVERMAGARRYVIVAMVMVAAMVTPPDVTSQLLLAGPMVLLYEVGLIVARSMVRRRDAARS